MTITFVNHTSNWDAIVTQPINLPTGIAANDVAVLFFNTRGGTGNTVTGPSGWTAQTEANNSTTLKTAVFWKVLTGSETTISVGNSTGAKSTWHLLVWRGVDTTIPIITASFGSIASAINMAVPGINTSGTNNKVIYHVCKAINTVLANPATLANDTGTGIFSTGGSAGTNISSDEGSKTIATTATNSGTETFTGTTAAVGLFYTIALKEAVTGTIYNLSTKIVGAGYSSNTLNKGLQLQPAIVGAGTTRETLNRLIQMSALIQGAATLRNFSPKVLSIQADLDGYGQVRISSAKYLTLTPRIIGSGFEQGSVNKKMTLVTSLVGSGTQRAAATKVLPVSSINLQGSGTLRELLIKALPVNSNIQGRAFTNETVTKNQPIASNIQGQGQLRDTPTLAKQIITRLYGAGTVKNSLGVNIIQFTLNATIQGLGQLRAATSKGLVLQPRITASGQEQAVLYKKSTIQTTLQGAGTVTPTIVKGLQAFMLRVSVQGNSVMRTTISRTAQIQSRIAGFGQVQNTAQRSSQIHAVIQGFGTVKPTVVKGFQAMALQISIQGNAVLRSTANRMVQMQTRITGAGQVSNAPAKTTRIHSIIVAGGQLTQTVTKGLTVSSVIQGAGQLKSIAAKRVSIQSFITGAGGLRNTTRLSLPIKVTIQGAAIVRSRMRNAASLVGRGIKIRRIRF